MPRADRRDRVASAHRRWPSLAPTWQAANIATPIDGDAAFELGLAAASEDRLDVAVQHLRWAAAVEPGNAKRAQSLAVALARLGQGLEAIRVLGAHERNDAPRLSAACSSMPAATPRPSRSCATPRAGSAPPDDWACSHDRRARADNDAVAVDAGQARGALGATDPEILMALATGLYHVGEFVECEKIAQQLITGRSRIAASASSASTRWRARSPVKAATSMRTRTRRKPRGSGPTASSPPS